MCGVPFCDLAARVHHNYPAAELSHRCYHVLDKNHRDPASRKSPDYRRSLFEFAAASARQPFVEQQDLRLRR